jgi:hypothetical protein
MKNKWSERKLIMQKTVEQIADEIGVDTQAVNDFLTAHRIRASREESHAKYYDEATQVYLKKFIEPTEKEKAQ